MIAELVVCCSLLAPGAAAADPPAPAGQATGNSYYYFLKGRQLESDGDVAAAIKAYEQAAILDPKSAEVRAELAGLYARQNRTRDAVEWADAALKLNPANAEANRVLGIVYGSLARPEDDEAKGDATATENAKKAIAHLEAARKSSGSLEPGLETMLGRLYLRSGAQDKAISLFRRLSEGEPERGEPIALLSQAYEESGKPEDAVRVLESAVADHPELYRALGELYERREQWPEAVNAYERAIVRSPRSADLKARLAIALLTAGGPARAGRAATVLQQARTQKPGDAQILYLLSQAQRLAGKLDDAESTAKQLMSVAPASSRSAYALAQVYTDKQQYQRVIETLGPVVSRTPAPGSDSSVEMVPALLSLGLALQELGQFDQALASFDRARSLAPGNDSIDAYALGAMVAAKRYDAALARSAKLLEARPGDRRIVQLRAEALRGAGRKEEAVALLRKAVDAPGAEASSYLALAELYAATEQYDDAVQVLTNAEKKFPGNLTVGFELGSVYERQKKFGDAERAFRDVLSKDPLYAPALNYLGYMLADRGQRLDESIGYIKRALAVEPYNGAYLDSLGWAYFKANRLDLAEENLKKAADQRVRDSAIQDHFGDVLFRLGRYQDAIEAWRRALGGDGEQVDTEGIDRKIRTARERIGKQ